MSADKRLCSNGSQSQFDYKVMTDDELNGLIKGKSKEEWYAWVDNDDKYINSIKAQHDARETEAKEETKNEARKNTSLMKLHVNTRLLKA